MKFGDRVDAWGRYLRSAFLPRPALVSLGDYAVTRTWRGDLIYLSNRDLGMTPSIAMEGRWERAVERVLGRLLRRGHEVVELGANVGYHTLGMARSIGPSGKLHAFEAHPHLTMLLDLTLRAARFSDRVTVHNVAVCDRAGAVKLNVDPLHSGSGHLEWNGPHPGYPQVFEVDAVRLDDVLADLPRIDLLRMDIEGSEGLALQGARALIRRSPGLHIVTEWDPVQMRVRSDVADVARWLADEGFRARLIKGSTLQRVEMRDLPDLPMNNMLLTRSA